jgi:hypothetical protein
MVRVMVMVMVRVGWKRLIKEIVWVEGKAGRPASWLSRCCCCCCCCRHTYWVE